MNTPTPTPRTDAATYPSDCLGKTLVTNRDLARALEIELNAITAERDQLRAERNNLRADLDAIKAILNEEKARAARAEDNLAALEQCHDDNCRGVVKIADDLTVERARLDWLLLDVVSRFDDAYYTRAAIDAAMKEDAK